MSGNNKQIFTNYNKNSKFLSLVILSLLFLSFIFLFFHLDQYANIVMAFIFFMLFVMVLIQLREYYLNPHTFEEVALGDEPIDQVSPVAYIKDVATGIKQHKKVNRWQKMVNTLLVVFFFLIYGVSTPTADNLPGFIFLVAVLILVNTVLFYFNFGYSDKKSVADIKVFVKSSDKKLYKFLAKHLSNKENWMIGIINFIFLFMIAVFFGINFDSYLKFVAIGFILILINSVLISDVRYAKQYESR